MIIVSIYNLQNELKQKASFPTQEEAQAWLQSQEAKMHTWRIKEGFYSEKREDVEPDYEVEETVMGITQKKYYYEQNYRIEIVNSEKIPELFNAEQLQKRRSEYPTLDEVIYAILEDDDSKLKDLKKRKKKVDDKYPFKLP